MRGKALYGCQGIDGFGDMQYAEREGSLPGWEVLLIANHRRLLGHVQNLTVVAHIYQDGTSGDEALRNRSRMHGRETLAGAEG